MNQIESSHYKILILGGGTAGVACAARLRNEGLANDVGLIEPADIHYYQPLWTLVGAGLFNLKESGKPMAAMIPKGVTWLHDSVTGISAKSRQVTLKSGKTVGFDWLIVATGLELKWDEIKGGREALKYANVSSIYDRNYVEKTWENLKTIDRGNMVFTFPNPPIKCAGAPQKIMYLADDLLRKRKARDRVNIEYVSALPTIFGVPFFAAALEKVVKRKNIATTFQYKIVEVKPHEQVAIFANVSAPNDLIERRYDYLHLVPPMAPHQFVAQSDLPAIEGVTAGWVDVDAYTLQHKRWPYVFALGDVSSTANAKTGASVRKQAPVVVRNLLCAMRGKSLDAKYDGYASCPLVTGLGKVILAEFGYDSKLMPSFPMDPRVERRSMWILKVFLLPKMYWNLMMKGRA